MPSYKNFLIALAAVPTAIALILPYPRGDAFDRQPQERRIYSTDKMPSEILYRRLVENPARTPISTFTPLPTNTPTPAPIVLSGADLFLQGYRAASGPEEYAMHFMDYVIPLCENKGRPDDGWYWDWSLGDFHFSAAQFHPNTWDDASNLSGHNDPTNLFHVGYNVATIIKPKNENGLGYDVSGQWPNCW